MYNDILNKINENSLLKPYFRYVEKLPKSYCKSVSNVKAIVLGCDPSTYNDKNFETVFNIGGNDKRYFSSILKNLEKVDLSLDNIYVDNLCKNYFNKSTTRIPDRIYRDTADIWIPVLKKELDERFNDNIIVLATSDSILNALIFNNVCKNNKEYYKNKLFITKKNNKLNRIIVPFFRHYKYELSLWPDYANEIKRIISLE